MKRILVTIFIFFAFFSMHAQIPNSFKYQAVVRNNNGEIMAKKVIGLKVSILQNSAIGSVVYSESFNEYSTNEFGLISVNVGSGQPISGSFGSIAWGSSTYYMQVDMDIQGGTNYAFMGVSQILAVPMAMYAINVKNNDDADADPSNEIQDLQLIDNTLTITKNANSTKIPLSQYIGVDTDKQNLSKKIIKNNVQILIERGTPVDFDLPTDYTNGGRFNGPIQATNLNLQKDFTLLSGGNVILNPTGNAHLTLPTGGTLATVENTLSTTHPAKDITTSDISNWKTAFSWENHAGLYRPLSYVPTWSEITSNPFLFTSVIDDQLLKYNSGSGKWENWKSNFLTVESDPVFGVHVAHGITVSNIADWTIAFKWGNHGTAGYLKSYAESDPTWTTESVNYYTKTNMQTINGAMLHFNNIIYKPTTLIGYGINDVSTESITATGTISTESTITATGTITGGALTTTGAVTGSSLVITRGLPTKFLKGDGSLDDNTYLTTSNASTTYLTTLDASTTYLTTSDAASTYYTKTNLQSNGGAEVHFNNITSKPNSLAGYGITDVSTASITATGAISTESTITATGTITGGALTTTGAVTGEAGIFTSTTIPSSFTTANISKVINLNPLPQAPDDTRAGTIFYGKILTTDSEIHLYLSTGSGWVRLDYNP